jgi:hypothetical protein
MAKVYADLPVPVGDGVGASVDTSAFAARKTITVGGTISSVACTIEVSQDDTDWAPLVTFTMLGKRTLTVAAAYMRVRISGSVGVAAFALNVDVGADEILGNFSAVNVPAGNGAGTALDVSQFGDFMSVIVAGAYTGSITIQISGDGTDWVPLLGFSSIGMKSKLVSAYRLRVLRAGVDPSLPGTPTVTVGAVDILESGLGGGSDTLVFRPGGVTMDNIYATWPELMAARALLDGPITIEFDDSILSPCVIPPGGPYDMTDTEWVGQNLISTGGTAVTVSDGASFTGLRRFRRHIRVSNYSLTGSPVADIANTDEIRISDRSDISTAVAGSPFFSLDGIAAGGYATLVIDEGSSISWDNTGPVIGVPDGVTLQVSIGEFSFVYRRALQGAATAVLYGLPTGTSAQLSMPQANWLGSIIWASAQDQAFKVEPETGTIPSIIPINIRYYHGRFVRLNAAAGVITQVLPQIGSGGNVFYSPGRWTGVSETSGTNGIIVDGYGAETINGVANYTIPPGGAALFISDGLSNWTVLGIDINTVLNRANTFTQAQGVAKVTLTDAATIATDAELGNVFEVTLDGNRTLGLPTNLVSGFTYMWIIKQDAVTGSRTLAYNAIFKFPGGAAPTLSTGVGDVDIITAVYDGTNLLCVFQADFS